MRAKGSGLKSIMPSVHDLEEDPPVKGYIEPVDMSFLPPEEYKKYCKEERRLDFLDAVWNVITWIGSVLLVFGPGLLLWYYITH